jgi:hypothetical protein
VPVDDVSDDEMTIARNALDLMARRAIIVVLAAFVLVLAIVVAGRNAPRTSGDLVQLWLVPVDAESAEVGLRNGIAGDLECAIVLDTTAGSVQRRIEVSPGQTYRETTSLVDSGSGAVTAAHADCQAEGRRFNRQVWLSADSTS